MSSGVDFVWRVSSDTLLSVGVEPGVGMDRIVVSTCLDENKSTVKLTVILQYLSYRL